MSFDELVYKAGNCNIGIREIYVRKKLLRFSLLLTFLLTITFLFWIHSMWALAFLFLSTFISILICLEIRHRFCILFGLFNLYNFGPLGNLDHVTNPDCGEKDRLKAFRIIILSFVLAIPYGLLVYFLLSRHIV